MTTPPVRHLRLALWAIALTATGSSASAADLGVPVGVPGYEEPSADGRYGVEYEGRDVGPRPRRRVTGGPGYVGSEWGLGKPSYYGIGTRPDWGRSSMD